MQPRKLIMKNFGPFIHEELDFGDFQEGGLFLVSGKTGAGKTTIFDGMTFALFGETSGNLRSGKEMRSTFASPTEETSVRFSFDHQHLHYEIERRPEQVLAKKRGDGVTNQAAKVRLTIFDQQGKERKQISKKNEVDAFIKDLLQLDAKQFFQIILLPQGEFRNFLIASSNEKEKVLRNIFGTEMYQRFNDWLKEQVKKQTKQIEKQQTAADHLITRFEWAEPAAPVSLVETLDYWQTDLEKQRSLQQTIEAKKNQAEQEKKTIQEAFYSAKEIHKALAEEQALRQQAEALATKESQISEDRLRLQQLDWVYEQQAVLRQKEERTAEAAQALQQLEANRQALLQWQEAQDKWNENRDIQEDLKKQQVVITQRLQVLAQLKPLAEQVQQQQQTVTALQKDVAQQEKQAQRLREQEMLIVDLEQELKATIQKHSVYQEQEVLLVRGENLLSQWQRLEQEVLQLSTKKQQLTDQQQQLQADQQQLVATQEQLTAELVQEKSQNAKMQIARLSLLLVEGEPCPVCGSCQHPAAQTHVDYSNEDIIDSERTLETLENQLNQVATERSTNQLLLEQVIEQLQILQQEEASLQEQQQTAYESLRELLRPVIETLFVEEMLQNEEDIEATDPKGIDEKLTETEIAETYFLCQKINQQMKQQFTADSQKLTEAQASKRQVEEERMTLEASRQTASDALRLEEGKLTSLQEQTNGVTLEQLAEEQNELTNQSQHLTAVIEADQLEEQRLKEQFTVLTEQQRNLQQFLADKQQAAQLAQERLEEVLPADCSEEEMRHLLNDMDQRTVLRKAIETYEQQQRFVQQRQLELAQFLQNKTIPNLEELEAQLRQQEQVTEQLQEKAIRGNEQLKQNQRLLEELQTIYQQNTKQLEKISHLQQLSEVINGENEKKTSLERYVLQRFLTEILEVANVRLARLTRGRYQFELADKVGSYRSSTGLEIDIYDDNAGSLRRAHTLSGGESFIAALALAISLADVIQNRSGGIEIEALFIDEGFGSLDEESLEMAMEALEMIENEGRMIGIISHVRELRERILQQVIVQTDGSGQSKIRTSL
jgi:exonuclease SbcC